MQRAEARGSGALWVRCLALGSGALLSAAAVGLGVVGIVLLALEYERSALGALLVGLGVVAALLRALLWTQRGFRVAQVTLRCCGADVPRNRGELRDALKRRPGAMPTIVGGGWGFWTAHAVVRGPCIFMHALRGQVVDADLEEHQVRFLAGSTIRDVVATLKAAPYRLTFWSTPSIQDITIGGWFGASCHGNSGAGGEPSSFAVDLLHVIDMAELGRGLPLQVQPWTYQNARRQFDDAAHRGESRYVIVSVTFDLRKMVPSSKTVQKDLRVIRTANLDADFATWMDDDAPLRVLFVGSARRDYALGLLYKNFDEDAQRRDGKPMPMRKLCFGLCGKTVHRDPHECSAECMSAQLDGCSMLCNGWYERDEEAYNGIMKMPDANAMTPSYDNMLFGLGVVHLLGIKNCEFVFRLREPILAATPSVTQQLAQLVKALIEFFHDHWGRAELRTRCKRDRRGVVFVDVGTNEAAMVQLVPILKGFAARCQIALHTGKYQSPALRASITKQAWFVTPADIYYGTAEGGEGYDGDPPCRV